jgi:hypothetical protein
MKLSDDSAEDSNGDDSNDEDSVQDSQSSHLQCRKPPERTTLDTHPEAWSQLEWDGACCFAGWVGTFDKSDSAGFSSLGRTLNSD